MMKIVRWKGGDIKMNNMGGRVDGKQHDKRGKRDEGCSMIVE